MTASGAPAASSAPSSPRAIRDIFWTALTFGFYKPLTKRNNLSRAFATTVLYKGMNEVVTALVGGQLQMAFLTASNAAQIRDGLLRPLGITAPQRAASFPDVPTMEEAGVDGMSAVSWAGFLAPARTPPMIIKKLENEIIRIVKLPDVQKRLRGAELDPVGNSADEFARTIKADVTTWTAVAKAAKIQIDQ